MGEDLDAPFRHLPRLEPRQREGGDPGRPAGVDRALHVDQRLHAKSRRDEPAMRRRGICNRESRKMDSPMAREGRVQLAAERRIGGLE